MDCRRVTWLSPIPQPICPTNTCAHCPKIPKCEAPKTRLLQFGPDLNVLPVSPLDKTVWEPPAVGGPPPPDTRESKPYCPVVPRRYYDYSLDNVQPNPEFRYRWKNETCALPSKLTGYKTLPFARPIPKYMGFKPMFPHPVPKPHPSPTTIELTSTMREQLRCPHPCDATPYRHGNNILCVSQLHPYTPFSAAVKVTNTW